jgi:hypothetical protein
MCQTTGALLVVFARACSVDAQPHPQAGRRGNAHDQGTVRSPYRRCLGFRARARRRPARTPRRQRDAAQQVELLNLIARAQGLRNWQALRQATRGAASAASAAPALTAAPIPPPPLSPNARRALAQFDDHGCLLRWPAKFSVQRLMMWVLWTRFDAKRSYTERAVNTILKAANRFFDHVTLRRELINRKLIARKSDCSDYENCRRGPMTRPARFSPPGAPAIAIRSTAWSGRRLRARRWPCVPA